PLEEKPDEKKLADEAYEPYLDEMIPLTWTANQEDAERLGILQTDIVNYVNTKMAQWITGEADVNAEWEGYLEQLNKLGLEEMTAIRNRALESVTE
ncbi:MAG: hypothetical protein GX916_01140, partial [Clostridiales bacterium]|nr:hypothetical protein [Clostridiales bacterium]